MPQTDFIIPQYLKYHYNLHSSETFNFSILLSKHDLFCLTRAKFAKPKSNITTLFRNRNKGNLKPWCWFGFSNHLINSKLEQKLYCDHNQPKTMGQRQQQMSQLIILELENVDSKLTLKCALLMVMIWFLNL